jgi:DNA-binding IclR family transcriptional regulator
VTSSVAGGLGYQTRALSRALAILDLFSEETRVLSVKDMHVMLAIPKPTIVRLASLLASEGYLRREDGGYTIGAKTLYLGSLYVRHNDFTRLCREPLEALAAETRQTASLAKLMGSRIVHLVVARSPRPVQHVKRAGSLGMPHATGVGKAILSRLPLETVDRILGDEPYPRLTPNTLCTRDALLSHLEPIRALGFAIDDEETALGLRCCAIPVAVDENDATAISVSGPAGEFTDSAIVEFVQSLHHAAVAVGEAIVQTSDYPPEARGLEQPLDPEA